MPQPEFAAGSIGDVARLQINAVIGRAVYDATVHDIGGRGGAEHRDAHALAIELPPIVHVSAGRQQYADRLISGLCRARVYGVNRAVVGDAAGTAQHVHTEMATDVS